MGSKFVAYEEKKSLCYLRSLEKRLFSSSPLSDVSKLKKVNDAVRDDFRPCMFAYDASVSMVVRIFITQRSVTRTRKREKERERDVKFGHGDRSNEQDFKLEEFEEWL